MLQTGFFFSALTNSRESDQLWKHFSTLWLLLERRNLISLSQFFCSLTSKAQRFSGEQKLPFSDDFQFLPSCTFQKILFGVEVVMAGCCFSKRNSKIAGNKSKVGRMSKQGGAEWQPWQLTCKHSEITYLPMICYSFSIPLMSDSFMIYHCFHWLGIYPSYGLTMEQECLAES